MLKKRKKEKIQRVLNVACGDPDTEDTDHQLNQMYMVNNTEENKKFSFNFSSWKMKNLRKLDIEKKKKATTPFSPLPKDTCVKEPAKKIRMRLLIYSKKELYVS